MYSLADVFFFLHQADPKLLGQIIQEIRRDLHQRQKLQMVAERTKDSDDGFSSVSGDRNVQSDSPT
jgi:hypothetical protein